MKVSFSILFLSFTLLTFGQHSVTLSGFVYDAATGEPLIGATIYDSNTKRGTISNEAGYYSLTIITDKWIEVAVSFIGYRKHTERVALKPLNNFYLMPGIDINEVTVQGNRIKNFARENEMGMMKVNPLQVKKLPGFFGETDIIKTLQLMPGVQSGGETKSDLSVRGGSSDQNLVLLDGVPLYYISHFGGFVSVFNTDALSDVSLIMGGFPARYGSRLSSVLDVKVREGNLNNYSVQGTVGLVTSKLLVEGPIAKGKSSFIFSVRNNLIPVFKLLDAGIGYSFYDITTKATFKPTERDKLIFSIYAGNDNVHVNDRYNSERFSQTQKRSTAWGTKLISLNWNRVFSDKLFGNNMLSVSEFNHNNGFDYSLFSDTLQKEIVSRVKSGILDVNLKTDFNWFISFIYNLRFGQQLTFHRFSPNNEEFAQTETWKNAVNLAYKSVENALNSSIYAENDFAFNKTGINAGIRFSSYHMGGTHYYNLEPRLLVKYLFTEKFSVKYAYSRMGQYVHVLSYSGVGMPNDFYMPSNEQVKPETSSQHAFGVHSSLFNNLFEISIETYYKTMSDLIAIKGGASLAGHLDNWVHAIETGGSGKAYGIEFFLNKPEGKTTGFIGATSAKSERLFAELNQGKPFPFKYDRYLDVSTMVVQEITESVSLSGNWSYGTGYPITLPIARHPSEMGEVYVYDQINGFRMRDYHRLDLAINIRKNTRRGEETWALSVFNVYNRKNPYYYYFGREFITTIDNSGGGVTVSAKEGDMKLYQRSFFSFFPSIAYSFKF